MCGSNFATAGGAIVVDVEAATATLALVVIRRGQGSHVRHRRVAIVVVIVAVVVAVVGSAVGVVAVVPFVAFSSSSSSCSWRCLPDRGRA